MKRNLIFGLLGACLLVGVAALAAEAPAKKMAKPTMARYMISVPHTAEECLAALDDFDAAKSLAKWDFGCKAGDHTAYMIVSAKSEEAAKAMVPEKERDKARVVELHKFTAAELKAAHSQMTNQ